MVTTLTAGVFYLMIFNQGFPTQIEFADAKACLTAKHRLIKHHNWQRYMYCFSRETGEEVE